MSREGCLPLCACTFHSPVSSSFTPVPARDLPFPQPEPTSGLQEKDKLDSPPGETSESCSTPDSHREATSSPASSAEKTDPSASEKGQEWIWRLVKITSTGLKYRISIYVFTGLHMNSAKSVATDVLQTQMTDASFHLCYLSRPGGVVSPFGAAKPLLREIPCMSFFAATNPARLDHIYWGDCMCCDICWITLFLSPHQSQ